MSSTPNYNIDSLLRDVDVCTSVVMQLMKNLMSISFQDITAHVRKDSRHPRPIGCGEGSDVYRAVYDWVDPQDQQQYSLKV